tara:strand:- start:476 stop:1378 length:903 start_codon:yes stop_codon:yes gene_type:complete
VSERITKGSENDYHPVNQYIDEQSKLRKARSFWINAKSWALILIAVGLLAVLLAWAYSLLDKYYVLKKVAGVQEKVIEKKVKQAIAGGNFEKTSENLSNLENNIGLTEKNEELEEDSKNKAEEIEKLEIEKNRLSSEISDLNAKIQSQEIIQEDLKKNMQETFGKKINDLESEKLESLKEIAQLKEELQNKPDNSELLQKLEELEKQGKGLGDLRYFTARSVELNNYKLLVKTRFHFKDVRKKPNKIECYINFGVPNLSDLELQTENQNFSVNKEILDKGFKKSDFINVKKEYCSWNYFD